MKLNKIAVSLAVFSIFIMSSCKKDSPLDGGNYLVFGTFYGKCVGDNCRVMFKLTGVALFQDSRHLYPNFSKPYDGDYFKLSESKYQLAKDLLNKIPSQLLSETEVVIGEPDAGDWGGVYVEQNQKGKSRFWIIDHNALNWQNVPEYAYLKPFLSEIDSTIAMILK